MRGSVVDVIELPMKRASTGEGRLRHTKSPSKSSRFRSDRENRSIPGMPKMAWAPWSHPRKLVPSAAKRLSFRLGRFDDFVPSKRGQRPAHRTLLGTLDHKDRKAEIVALVAVGHHTGRDCTVHLGKA